MYTMSCADQTVTTPNAKWWCVILVQVQLYVDDLNPPMKVKILAPEYWLVPCRYAAMSKLSECNVQSPFSI